MNKYQRKNQVTDQELNQFKQGEINKIFAKTSRMNDHKKWMKPKLAISFMVVTLVFVIGIVISKEPSEPEFQNNLQITKLSDNDYFVTSILNGETFHLYYQSHLVYEGEEVDLNDQFSYKMRYIDVPKEVSENIEVKFEIFQVDDFRYFVYSEALGEENFYEFDYFYGRSRSFSFGTGMTFKDFEEDMKAIYELIDEYPPQLIDVNQYDVPRYGIDESVYEIENQRLVSNYEYYVENHYLHEHFNGDQTRDKNMTVFVDNVIILDESNQIIDNIVDTHSYDRIASLDEYTNKADGSFQYIVKDVEYQPSLISYNLGEDIKGYFSHFNLEEGLYAYTIIDLDDIDIDLTETAYITYLYDFGPYDQDGTKKIDADAFIFHNHLITKPYLFSDDKQPNFWTMTFEFYNEADEMIYRHQMNEE